MDIKIPAGTIILREGEINMDMYKVVDGNCEVYSGFGTSNESIMGILSKGTFFGETGFFAQRPSIYTVVAYSDVVLERIIMRDFESYAKEHFMDVLSIMKNMTDTMYNLKFNMDMLLKDISRNAEEEERELPNETFLREQFKKYHLMGRHSLSFFNTKV